MNNINSQNKPPTIEISLLLLEHIVIVLKKVNKQTLQQCQTYMEAESQLNSAIKLAIALKMESKLN